jgi:hypothetical protein
VDAAFLGFWGCACPLGEYWGYASADALAAEQELLQAPDLPLGAIELILQNRSCQPCPADLPVRCSPLAVVRPPHILTASVYPLISGRRLRSMLPYLDTKTMPTCLHPAVCAAPAAYISDWAAWSALASNGTTETLQFADIQCREGHDSSSPLCAACLQGFWLDGFLCRPCFEGAQAVVIIGVLAGAALLGYVIARHHRQTGSPHHYATVILWFFQVAHTLQVSIQINAAQHGAARVGAEGGAGLASYLPILSFRPWALECLIPAWNFKVTSGVLFAVPWLVALVTIFARSWRRVGVFLLDLLYLPVAQRGIQWFNFRTFPVDGASQVCRAAFSCTHMAAL